MTHDGSNVDAHLQALHDHAVEQREQHRQVAFDTGAEIEAEREALEANGGHPAPPPADAA